MPILMILEMPEGDLDKYERLNELMKIRGDEDAPAGLIDHVAGHDGEQLVIVDIWESEEALGRFFEGRLGPALAAVGLPTDRRPRILEVHNSLEGMGEHPGVIVLIEVEGFGTDKYDEMASKMDAHVGDGSTHPGVSHTAARGEDGGVVVVDVWESPEAFAQFAETEVGPAGAAVGIGPLEPRIVPVHNRIRGRARQHAG